MINKTPLQTKKPVGNGIVSPDFKNGETTLIKGGGNVGYSSPAADTSSGANLSAKYKYPNVHQDVPDAGKDQYTATE